MNNARYSSLKADRRHIFYESVMTLITQFLRKFDWKIPTLSATLPHHISLSLTPFDGTLSFWASYLLAKICREYLLQFWCDPLLHGMWCKNIPRRYGWMLCQSEIRHSKEPISGPWRAWFELFERPENLLGMMIP